MPRLLPLFVFGVTMLLTGLTTIAFEHSERARQQLRLQVKTDEIAAALEQNMATNVAVLRSGRALFAVLDKVDRETFERFVSELNITGSNRGVRAFGWSLYTNVQDVPAIEQEMQSHGVADFKAGPLPLPRAGMTHIILYIKSIDGNNKAALGYNMYSELIRRAAMLQATRTGLPVATAPLQLLVDADQAKSPGIIVFVPVYARNVDNAPPHVRERQLKGFIYSSVRIADFVKALNINHQELNASVTLYDVSGTAPQLVYLTHENVHNDFRAKQTVQVANRKWQLVLGAERGAYFSPLPALIFAFGVALSLLLGSLTALILLGGRNAEMALRAIKNMKRSATC